MIQAVFLYPNLKKEGVAETLPLVCRILQQSGMRLLLPTDQKIKGVENYAPETALQLCDLAITLGGDGTLLRIARLAAEKQVPLLGINLGHIGFMTELEKDELGQLNKICSGEYEIDERMMLHLAVRRNNKVIFDSDALNDIVIANGTAFRVVRVQLSSDSVPVIHFSGDGVILATPTGSTAYSLSAGGPIIEPSAENIVVTPICAHALAAKSFVFAPERIVSVRAHSEEECEICVSADGTSRFSLRPSDTVEVTRSALVTRLVRVKGSSFYRILQQKL